VYGTSNQYFDEQCYCKLANSAAEQRDRSCQFKLFEYHNVIIILAKN